MEKLIGIVIPEQTRIELIQFCARFDKDPIEPYMALVTPDKLESIKRADRKMQSFCLSQPPFKTVIGGPNLEILDTGTVFYLSVMMGPLNTVRSKLMQHFRLPAGAFFRAQLILISSPPDSDYDFDKILAEGKKTFSQPREISVDSLAIYSRDDGEKNFKIDSEYPFTGR